MKRPGRTALVRSDRLDNQNVIYEGTPHGDIELAHSELFVMLGPISFTTRFLRLGFT